MDSGECVLSDIHADKVIDDHSSEVTITRFVFRSREDKPNVDSNSRNCERNQLVAFDTDGDFDIERDCNSFNVDVIQLHHHMSTDLSSVGLQVWRGALVMCDYILHQKERFLNKHILELGCGTGLTGIIAGQYAASVVCTDFSRDVLDLCRQNMNENSRLKNPNCICYVETLDWFADLNLTGFRNLPDIVLIADCVYDNDLTDALFRTLRKLQTSSHKHKPVIFISLEKRLNFTLAELNVTCKEYDHFRQCLNELQNRTDFIVEKLSLDFVPLYFDYDRTRYVELWEIHS